MFTRANKYAVKNNIYLDAKNNQGDSKFDYIINAKSGC